MTRLYGNGFGHSIFIGNINSLIFNAVTCLVHSLFMDKLQ